MKPNISEFSYGYALTSEIMNAFKLSGIGAPYFPTLQEEGKSGGGYDMKLPGLPIFIQFKLSQCLTTKNAMDYSTLGLPYYRFHIRAQKYSQQHQLLLDLESKGEDVFYAAPRFHEPDELNQAFSQTKVIERSIFFRPGGIGKLPDDGEHSVSFGSNGVSLFRSDPKDIDSVNFLQEIQQRREETKSIAIPFRTTRELVDELIDIYMTRSVGEERDRANRLRDLDVDRSAFDHINFLTRNLFGSEVIFLD